MSLQKCSYCKKKLEYSAFDSKKNETLNKKCRNCVQRQRKSKKRLRERRTKEASSEGRRACSNCTKKLELSAFDSKKNRTLNKTCRHCVEINRKSKKRLRERLAKEASSEGRRCCSKCTNKLELSAFDSNKDGNLYKSCRKCMDKNRKYTKKRRRDKRTKENSTCARPTKRLKRIVDDICDEVRARLKNRRLVVSDVKQEL